MSRRTSTTLRKSNRRRAGRHVNAFGLYSVLFAMLAVCQFALLAWQHVLAGIAFDWLAAVNVTAVIAVAFDKAISRRRLTRVPEIVLLALAACGGSPGALLTMRLAHHKIAKRSFLLRMAMILVVQATLVVVWIVVRS